MNFYRENPQEPTKENPIKINEKLGKVWDTKSMEKN